MQGRDQDSNGLGGRTSLYSYSYGHGGLLHVLMARCTHRWVNVPISTVDLLEMSKYRTLWYTDTCIRALLI